MVFINRETSRRRLFGCVLLLALLVVATFCWRVLSDTSPGLPLAAQVAPTVDTAPLCPWREPQADLQTFFPTADGYVRETRILSQDRLELARRLGRPPTPEEHSLYLYRAVRGGARLGTIVVQRLKGEYGAIEVVVAVGTDGRVRGVRLQRLREPDAIARALQSPSWLAAFKEKTAGDPLRVGQDLPAVPPEALTSARAVVDGVRSLLIVLKVAEERGLKA